MSDDMNKPMSAKEMAERLANICYGPNTASRDDWAVQLFIEIHVLPEDIGSYTKEEMEMIISAYLLENAEKLKFRWDV
jgi:hypothetical protein